VPVYVLTEIDSNIRADERLLAIFDGKKVFSMFEMTKLVNGHLV